MTSQAGSTDADRYVLGRYAVQAHIPPDELPADLQLAEAEQQVPSARSTFAGSQAWVAERLRRRGGDLNSPEYADTARQVRTVLNEIDDLGDGHAA